ncbi:FemAB family XrtA/PEP-CTERM system-associated protein [Kordiimonas aquimaris]|uniref:FemAB family XrtA/PEP-CTERM system-associated protein n=1 Tax=Kordiimonas aquimaris TaxID=707591 RepID=UPI0021D36953|nr:FemAB family XrtA/PEP-CTERM system-associated protein [Kordiimonas aquimaris]
MSVRIVILEEQSFAAWDDFLIHQKGSTFCHRSGWKTVIEQGARQACPYLIAYQGTEVVGILPLSIKKHFLFGKALISNMFCVYGGAVALDDTIAESLYNAAWDLANKENIPVFENRTRISKHQQHDEWIGKSESATFIRDLADDEEQQLLDIPRKQRAVIRKSLKREMVTDWNGDFSVFYDLYAQSVLTLGTPVFPKRLFIALRDVFADDVEIQITRNNTGEAVASLMSFYYCDTVMPYYAGGNALARPLAAHDYMYFQLMIKARERGVTRFDFGRSKIDSGPYKFKKNWGFEPTEMQYEWRLREGITIPEMSQHKGVYGQLAKWWKKLPLPVSKIAGPIVSRHLG